MERLGGGEGGRGRGDHGRGGCGRGGHGRDGSVMQNTWKGWEGEKVAVAGAAMAGEAVAEVELVEHIVSIQHKGQDEEEEELVSNSLFENQNLHPKL